MHLIRDISDLSPSLRGCALAIGNFDGLHLGHRAVLDAMCAQAKEDNVAPAVMTFEPHPRRYFRPDERPYRIEPLHIKLRRLRRAGIEHIYMLRFNETLAQCPAQKFIESLLHERLGVSHVVTGENFVFGHRRGGNTGTLRAAEKAGLFGYTAVPPVKVHNESCSSSRIRAHLLRGEVDEASALLGRPYEITTRVVHGDARGRELGAPTANLRPIGLFLPRYGVYAVRYRVSDGGMYEQGREWREGVANLGIRPTFGDSEPVLEVHGFDEDRTLYGKRMRVRLEAYLREEIVFPSPDALREQIQEDVRTAQKVLAS